MAHILLVEDDVLAAKLAKEWLEKEAHVVDVVHDGDDGGELALRDNGYDLLIVDWELPGKTGLDIISLFRKRLKRTPVIFVTGRSSIEDKEGGFRAGADDYLTKPYELRELSARVAALLRRPLELRPDKKEIASVTMDFLAHKVHFKEEEVFLKPREFALLELMIRSPNQVFSPETLKSRLWQFDDEIGNTGIRVLISRLRHKLGQETSPIKTVYGVGYTFSTEQIRTNKEQPT